MRRKGALGRPTLPDEAHRLDREPGRLRRGRGRAHRLPLRGRGLDPESRLGHPRRRRQADRAMSHLETSPRHTAITQERRHPLVTLPRARDAPQTHEPPQLPPVRPRPRCTPQPQPERPPPTAHWLRGPPRVQRRYGRRSSRHPGRALAPLPRQSNWGRSVLGPRHRAGSWPRRETPRRSMLSPIERRFCPMRSRDPQPFDSCPAPRQDRVGQLTCGLWYQNA